MGAIFSSEPTFTGIASPAAPGTSLTITRTQDYDNAYVSANDYAKLGSGEKLWYIWVGNDWSPKAFYIHSQAGVNDGEIFFDPGCVVGTQYKLKAE